MNAFISFFFAREHKAEIAIKLRFNVGQLQQCFYFEGGWRADFFCPAKVFQGARKRSLAGELELIGGKSPVSVSLGVFGCKILWRAN